MMTIYNQYNCKHFLLLLFITFAIIFIFYILFHRNMFDIPPLKNFTTLHLENNINKTIKYLVIFSTSTIT